MGAATSPLVFVPATAEMLANGARIYLYSKILIAWPITPPFDAPARHVSSEQQTPTPTLGHLPYHYTPYAVCSFIPVHTRSYPFIPVHIRSYAAPRASRACHIPPTLPRTTMQPLRPFLPSHPIFPCPLISPLPAILPVPHTPDAPPYPAMPPTPSNPLATPPPPAPPNPPTTLGRSRSPAHRPTTNRADRPYRHRPRPRTGRTPPHLRVPPHTLPECSPTYLVEYSRRQRGRRPIHRPGCGFFIKWVATQDPPVRTPG